MAGAFGELGQHFSITSLLVFFDLTHTNTFLLFSLCFRPAFDDPLYVGVALLSWIDGLRSQLLVVHLLSLELLVHARLWNTDHRSDESCLAHGTPKTHSHQCLFCVDSCVFFMLLILLPLKCSAFLPVLLFLI